MATNHTSNYQLNQWEPTDQVLHTDFNEDNAKIDAALKSLNTTVQQHTTQISQVQTALSKCGTCKFYRSDYTGDGQDTRAFSFPSKPVIIFLTRESGNSFIIHPNAASASVEGAYIGLSWSGSTLTITNQTQYFSAFNTKDTSYHMLALLDSSL